MGRSPIPAIRVLLFSALLLLLNAILDGHGVSHGNSPDDDPLFAQVGFDRWIAAGEHTAIPWKVQIHPPQLSWGLRTIAGFTASIQGKEAKRRFADGRLAALLQITDREGRTFRDSGTIAGSQPGADLPSRDSYIQFLFRALLTPGDYRVALAIVDPSTGEYSFTSRPLLVAGSPGPLPDLWRALPTVEFLPREEPPAAWFHPSLEGRLNLKLSAPHPVRVKVVLNLPSSGMPSSAYDEVMSVLVYELRVLTQMRMENGTLDVALLDSARHRVAFEQANIEEVDWPRLRAALRDAAADTIDVQSLGMRGRDADFFMAEVNRRLPGSVVILLGSPTIFEQKKAIPQAAESDGRIFYLLRPMATTLSLPGSSGYSAVSGDPTVNMPIDDRSAVVGRNAISRPRRAVDTGVVLGKQDDVAWKALKLAHPRVFELKTAEQFRDALAAVLAEIAEGK